MARSVLDTSGSWDNRGCNNDEIPTRVYGRRSRPADSGTMPIASTNVWDDVELDVTSSKRYVLTMPTLYGEIHWDSPWVMTAFVAMREKGLGFDVKEFDLRTGEHRHGDFAAQSLIAKVPALEFDGFWLSESQAIVEFLEERYPPPTYRSLLPTSLEDRARARQVLSWLRTDLMALRRERPTESMFFKYPIAPLTEAARADAEKLIRVTEQLLSPDARYLFGEWCIADSDLGFALHRLILNGDPVPQAVKSYAAAQWQRASLREFVQHARVAPNV